MGVDLSFVEDLKYQWMAMIDAIDDPLAIVDSEGCILRLNLAFVRRAINKPGLNLRDFAGHHCYEIFAGRSSRCPDCLLWTCGENHETWTSSSLFDECEIEIRVHPLTLDGSGRGRYLVHYRDVTEAKQMQQRLAQADKLAALGKLAGGVAHEINSPIAGVLAFAQMVIREMDQTDPHLSDLREIEDAARKCKVIVENLLNFARQDGTVAEETNITDVLEPLQSTLRLAGALIRKHQIEFHTELPTKPLLVTANPLRLGQVFLNLITNAIHAMKESGGTLTVEAHEEDTMVIVTVHDTGVGIHPHSLKRIFDPFFTTKPIGEGTGLGLSIAYSFIKQYGGDICAESTLGEGSSFSVHLPKALNQ